MEEIEMLNMSDPDFPEKLKAALGLKDGEALEIITPRFERTDGIVPSTPVDAWSKLPSLSVEALRAIGCGKWSEPDADGKVLMLFPYQWYDHIPEGYELTCISGETEKFQKGKTDDDYRFGCLAYGIKVAA